MRKFTVTILLAIDVFEPIRQGYWILVNSRAR
jgi:hypothetical protein